MNHFQRGLLLRLVLAFVGLGLALESYFLRPQIDLRLPSVDLPNPEYDSNSSWSDDSDNDSYDSGDGWDFGSGGDSDWESSGGWDDGGDSGSWDTDGGDSGGW